jgi:hypothetical protein
MGQNVFLLRNPGRKPPRALFGRRLCGYRIRNSDEPMIFILVSSIIRSIPLNSLLKNGDWLRRGPKFHSIQKHRKVPVPLFQRAVSVTPQRCSWRVGTIFTEKV